MMLCPLCKQDCTNGHVCSTVLPTDDAGEAAVAALSSRYEALKGAVLGVFKTVGGEPGDTPEKAVTKGLRAAKVEAIKQAIALVKDHIVEAQRARHGLSEAGEAVEVAYSRGYSIGWGDGLAGLLEALEKLLASMEADRG